MRDLDDVYKLLMVHEKAMGHPRLKSIADRAMQALEAHAAESVPKPAPEPEPDAPVESVDHDEPGNHRRRA